MMQGYGNNFRAPKVDAHQFAMIPRADIPRSSFRMQNNHKTTIQSSMLVPVFLQEVLPGDSFNVSMSSYCRMATPLFPLLDNLDLESFFFFVPCRLVWNHWYKFMGEQDNPSDSISFSIPQCNPGAGYGSATLQDYMGLINVGQNSANAWSHSALPLRCYNLIWNQWFRDENLQTSAVFGSTGTSGPGGAACMDDGPDLLGNYSLLQVNRRHDYFTSCLPWTQKGGVAVTLPLGTSAPVKTQVAETFTGAQAALSLRLTSGAAGIAETLSTTSATPGLLFGGTSPAVSGTTGNWYPTNLYADLSTATAATINAIRLAFQTQKLLERDARGGTRYTEIIRSHFGVISPDMRLQRPEYLGGGKSPVNVAPVPQTTATGLTGGSSPLGTLAAVGTVIHRSGFRQSFTEHGYILGLVTVRATQAYQQGLRKLWSRFTRYDFYFPVFAALGEQAVLNKEIYSDGSVNDGFTFGYQERWAEYRYHPSQVTGFFRSTYSAPLDAWHLGIKYTALPALNSSFIQDATGATLARNLALAGGASSEQFLCDFFFDERVQRPMPMYSVPGLIDHF